MMERVHCIKTHPKQQISSNIHATNLQLLARVDETDLINLNTLLLLEGLLDGKDLVFGLKIEGLLTAC